jgi:hypothetical protein
MKLPSFGTAQLQARVALAAGRKVSVAASDLLGLQFWWQFPSHLRHTRAGQHRPDMVRKYVRAIRERQHEVSAAAVNIGEVKP